METVLPASLFTTTLIRGNAQSLKKAINNQGILTKKGRKIQLTKDGKFIICGIDSLEDDYYGCQSSYEAYFYDSPKINMSKKPKQESMTATKDINVEKKEKADIMSTSAAVTNKTEITINMIDYSNTETTKLQADVFTRGSAENTFEYGSPERSSTYTSTTESPSTTRLSKRTKGSTSPMFARSGEIRTTDTPSSKISPESNNIGNVLLLTSNKTRTPNATTTITPEYFKQWIRENAEIIVKTSSPRNVPATASVMWRADTQSVAKHLFYY